MSSTPDASGTRQRGTKTSTDADVVNPASLSASSSKKVARNKPHVKPPFWDMSMNRFLTYMGLGLVLLCAFYLWRFTVWAAAVGGYWNLITGARPAPTQGMESAMDKVREAAGEIAQQGQGRGKGKAIPDTQSQIISLASALGIKPADLSSAIRPLIDPAVPNPAEACQRELELLKLQIASGAGAATGADGGVAGSQVDQKAAEGSFLGMAAEALLD